MSLLAKSTFAQPLIDQIPQGFRNDPHVIELVQTIEQWNRKDLKFRTRQEIVTQLQDRVRSVVAAKKYPYQTESWAQTMLSQASSLPQTLQPEARISDAAALVLVASFIKNIDQFKKEVPAPSVKAQLQVPLYVILSDAQRMARNAVIDAEQMIRAMFKWWTTIWPFCDK
jgi:hypothetical protein